MADKRVSIVFDASMNIAQVKSAVGEIQKAFSNVTMPQNISSSFSKTLESLTREIANFEQRAAKGLENTSDFTALSKSGQKILNLYEDLQAAMRRLGTVSDKDLTKLFPPSLANNIEKATAALKEYETAVKQNQKNLDSQTEAVKKQQTEIDKLKQSLQDVQSKKIAGPDDFKQMKQNLAAAEQELSNLQNSLKQAQETAAEMEQRLNSPNKSSKYRAQIKEIEELEQKIEAAKAKFAELNNEVNNTTTYRKQQNDIQDLTASITEAEAKMQEMQDKLSQMQAEGNTQALENLRQALSKIEGIDLSKFPNTIEGMRAAIASLDAQGLDKLKAGFEQLNSTVQSGAPAMQDFSARNREAAAAMDDFNRKSRDVEALKSRIQYFFGISNAINLFRKAVTSALETVKELDKAMTDTAVVTDYSVGDMWADLPRYTEAANSLGTTTLGAYETMTLFYQQGLKTNEVFQVGTETMKMARIAGMDYAEATNMMTAALRGFNMEINDTSAQRVNDVYSKLAAITASNTQEISTAMTKTASIANSANMEFETTAAFLSQIIETTRESAETAGTAMKTVIARFQELKKDPNSMELIDGEAVDANKIETALKSIGVALRDTEGEFRDLDDVFLDIAERWDGLSTSQQRYIATMAAGSRQQSRFIAMMSDYERTLQLIDAANNSAGASQAQFEKTIDSLESKLNRLTNAWNAYTMGISNSGVIKGAVDLLTNLLTIINKVTDALPGVGSGIGKIAVAFLGLKAGAAIFDSFFLNLKTVGTPMKALGLTVTQTVTNIITQISKLKNITNLFNKSTWFSTPKIIDIGQVKQLTVAYENLAAARAAAATMTEGMAGREAALAAEAAATKTLSDSLAALGLSEAEYAAIKRAGLSTSQEAIILSNEEVLSKAKEIIASETLTEAEKQEALAKLALDNQTKLGIATRLKYIATLLFGGEAARATAASMLGLAVAENGATVATSALGAAFMALPFGWVIAAIAAIIAAIVLIKKAVDAADPNKQLEKAKDAAEKAGDAVDDTRKSVEELKTSLDELDDSYDTINNLTRGTEEWRETVEATNSQVLDLISSYKELAPLVKNDGGVLRLDVNSDEVKNVIRQREKNLLVTESAYAAAKIKVEEKQQQVNWKNLPNNAKISVVQYYKDTNAARGQQKAITREEYEAGIAGNNPGKYHIGSNVSQDITEALAKAIARGEVRDTGEGIAKNIESWLTSNLVFSQDELYNGAVTNLAESLSESAGSLRQFGDSLISSEAAIDVYKEAMINNAREYSDISKTLTGDLVNNLSEKIFSGKLDTALEDEKAKLRAKMGDNKSDTNQRREVLQQFADMYDEYEVMNEKLIDMTTGKVAEVTDEYIISQVAAANATETLANEMDNLSSVFSKIDDANTRNTLAALLSNEGSGITDKMLRDMHNNGLNLDKLSTDAGFDNFQQMANEFGLTTQQMFDLVEENIRIATDKVVEQRKNLVGSMKRTSRDGSKEYSEIAETLASLEARFESFGLNFRHILQGMFNALEATGDQKLVNVGYKAIMDAAELNDNGASALKISNFIQDIDWSNPIEAVYQLNQEIEHGSELTANLASQFLKVGSSAYDASSQLKYMLRSADFEDAQADIDELVASNGKLSTMDVLDLASSYKTLDKYLKNTKSSASGLAKALSLIAKGKGSIDQLSNAVLAALNNFDSLDGMVAELLQTLSNFDPGMDENDVADFISNAYDTINSNLEKGAVGNNQNFSYLDLLLGDGWRKTLDEDGHYVDMRGDQLVEQMRYVTGELGKNAKDMRYSWSQLAKGKDFYGNAAGSLGQLTITDTGTEILLDNFEGMTTNQIVDQLREAYNVSSTYAKMMLADFKNYSGDLAAELRDNDFAAAMQAAFEQTGVVKTNSDNAADALSYYNKELFAQRSLQSRVIDESEIALIAEAWNKDTKAVKEYFNTLARENGSQMLYTNYYDESGMLKSSRDITEQFKQVHVQANSGLQDGSIFRQAGQDAGNSWLEGWATSTRADGTQVLYIDQLYKEMESFNVPEGTRNAVASEIAQSIYQGANSGAEQGKAVISAKLSDGKFHDIEIGADIDVDQAIANAERDLQNQNLANAIVDAFGETEITLTVNGEEVTGQISEIKESIAGDPVEIPVQVSEESMASIPTDIEAAVSETEAEVNAVVSEGTQQNIADSVQTGIETGVENADTDLEPEVTNTSEISASIKSAIEAGIASANKTVKVDANTSSLTSQISSAISSFNGRTISLNATIKGNVISVSGTTQKFAKGTDAVPHTGPALTGEEGPELVQTQGGAYVVGTEGPTITYLQKDDKVYTADETKKILEGNADLSDTIPRYASGYNNDWGYQNSGINGNNNVVNSNNTTNVNGDEVEDEPDLWENPYDWLYNLTEKINENLRVRNNLETKFQILQKRGRTSMQITSKYYNEQFRLMEETYDLQEEMYNKRKQQMRDYMADNEDMRQYGYFDEEKMRIVIDWDLIQSYDQTENVEEGERIEEYISKLEEIQDQIEDAEAAMLEVALQSEELKDELRDAYIELETRAAEALEQIDRDEVEALEQIYDAVTKADEDLLDAMREQINEYRQARDNRETEEDIAKKERRLAYMRQDTSGSNKTDILQLEDEIERARQQYQDKLVDQALTNLQTQQDYAAEQREKQIALMESQIDWNVKNGVYLERAAALIEAAFQDDHFLTSDDELYQILRKGEHWDSKSQTMLNKIYDELVILAEKANYARENAANSQKDTDVYDTNRNYMAEMERAYANAGGQMTNEIYKLNEERNRKIREDPELAAKYPQLSNSELAEYLKEWYKNNTNKTPQSGINSAGNDFISEFADSKPATSTQQQQTQQQTQPATQPTPAPAQTTTFKPTVGSYVRVPNDAYFTTGQHFATSVRVAGVISGMPGAFKVLKDDGGGNYWIGRSWTSGGVTGLINEKYLAAYKNGGLADFTGPAWLDGTKSAPEMVLNAKDTQNFIELRDILRDSLGGAMSAGKSGGDTYQFDIDVNEPHIESDYDVDSLVARVESDIYDKSVYRNVNAVTRLR